MITINYQTFGNQGFQLRLRLYQDGETKYINVTKMLKGNLQKKFWNPKKQLFVPSCPFSEENNSILVKMRQRYEEAALSWDGSLYGFLADMAESEAKNSQYTLSEYIQIIIGRLAQKKHSDGTLKDSFADYLKTEKRVQEYCKARGIKYEKLLITELNAAFINGVFNWNNNSRGGRGIKYISKTLHSIVMKAEKDGYLDSADFKTCLWYKAPLTATQKFNTLTEEQIRKFMAMDLFEIHNSRYNELYRDFCLFLLYTGQSACDALSLKYSDIQKIGGISHFIFKRRKIVEKQLSPCAVPISSNMEAIMRKWKKLAKDGYIFPVRSKKRIAQQITNNGDIKHFVSYLNAWLKKIGKALGCSFPLHTYTFRHTAITRYISKGVPVTYVANMMGTSIDNCQTIYYNNLGDESSRNKTLTAMNF